MLCSHEDWRALADFSGAASRPLPEKWSRYITDDALIILDEPHRRLRRGDLCGWLEAMQQVETNWLRPLLAAGIRFRVDDPVPGQGIYWRPAYRWKFWKVPPAGCGEGVRDMYRLGREDAHHVRRGLTRVKELLAAGVNVAYASNNVRDGYRPLGNFDLLEEGLILAYGAHMDSVDQLETLLCMSTYNAAQALRLKNYGLEKRCTADLVVLDAPTPSAAIIGQAEKRYVFKAGRLMATSQTMIQLFNGSNLSQTRLP